MHPAVIESCIVMLICGTDHQILFQATVGGIEVLLPAIVRINSGGASGFTDALGQVWASDTNFVGEWLHDELPARVSVPA